MKLKEGMCLSCFSRFDYYSMDFENNQRILLESLHIIGTTKCIETLRSRKDICYRSYGKMKAINDQWHFLPDSAMPSLDDIVLCCESNDLILSNSDYSPDVLNYDFDLDDPPPTPLCPRISTIEDTYISMYPWNQGIDMDFRSHPENVDKAIECYRKQISYYYEKKELYTSQGPRYAKTWENTFEHCHNSRNPDFCLVETAEKHLATLLRRRHIYLDFEGVILNTISKYPGVLQKDLSSLIDPDLDQQILSDVRKLSASGKIKRIKVGRAYTLYPPDTDY